ncbi:hypothetical protein [Thioclava pacifica]|uniref:Uncharacterized protein n=1 Tax=Thioclava pacifica DSM 10166 TaxID=1353537 RepID=A0A074K1H5_9RHOB|nr:hypothetical protein [Thioclava pacifica]KEO55452.1 hypothetical protein TP2_15545 [Thioclava pacifica DSM 10166]
MTGGTTDGSGKDRDAGKTREERLAEALRANLRRRKAQARARKPDAAPPEENKSEGS